MQEKPETRFSYDKEAVMKYQAEVNTNKGPSNPTITVSSNELRQIEDEEDTKTAKRQPHTAPLSQMELEEQKALYRRLAWEKELILEKITTTIAKFDEEMNALRKEKLKAEADLKVLDIKMLILHQELELLKDFEKEDINLAEKLQAKRTEKAAFTNQVEEFQGKLQIKTKEIEEIDAQIHVSDKECMDLIGESPFLDALKKIYYKNVKKMKKSSPAQEESFGYGSDDDRADAFDYDMEEEEEVEDDVKPAECDEALFLQILEMREKRLSQEEVKNEVKKASEVIKKEIETLMKKEKIISNVLLQTENELQELQKNKQDKLNELNVLVSLRLSQYKCLAANSLQECLVFTNDEFEKLQKRIGQLNNDHQALAKDLHNLEKDFVNLNKEKNVKKAKNKQLEAKAIEVQMLKFGQIINLEALENKSVNKPAEELKDKISKEDKSRMHELETHDSEIRDIKHTLKVQTIENTELLQKLADLTEAQRTLESVLDVSQQTMVAEYSGAQKKERLKEQKLLKLAQEQAHQIESMKQEVTRLKRKTNQM